MESRGVRPSILILLCLVVYPAALARLVFLPIDGSTLWRGYYTLLVPEGVRLSEVEARLEGAGLKNISASNARLEFTDFSGPATVTVADLFRRFDPSDPRLDPYLRGAPELFSAGHDRLIYLRSRAGILATELQLRAVLSGMPWRLADASAGAQLGGIALLLLVALLAATQRENRRLLAAARTLGMLPWIPLAATGAPALVASALLLYGGWTLLLDRGLAALEEWGSYGRFEGRPLAQGVGVMAAGLLAVWVLGTDRLGLRVVAGVAFAADLSVAGVLFAARASALSRRAHRLFVPVAVFRRSLFQRGGLLSFAALALLFLLMQAPAFLGWVDPVRERLPSPVSVAGVRGWSEAALAGLWKRVGGGSLPDAASYLAHRAYQAGLSYGRPYGFPKPEERIMLDSFQREGVRIREARVSVERLGGAWYARVMREGDGLTPLFRAEIRPSATRLVRPTERFGLGARGWLLWPLGLLVLVPLIVLRDDLTPQMMYGMRSPVSRRKQQAA